MLSQEEAQATYDALGMHLEQSEDARERMIEDNTTLVTFDDFVDTLQAQEIHIELITNVQGKLVAFIMEGGSHDGG